MLEIKKAAVSFDEQELLTLERIVTDADEKEAIKFLKQAVYDKILHSQQGRLKSHLDSANPVGQFVKDQS